MKIINMPRGTGKTARLIQAATVTGYPIICRTEAMRHSIIATAKAMHLSDFVDVYTYKEWNALKHIKPDNTKVFIDEFEDLIEDAINQYMGCEVMAATMTHPFDIQMSNDVNRYTVELDDYKVNTEEIRDAWTKEFEARFLSNKED